jgi:hypothetical protein
LLIAVRASHNAWGFARDRFSASGGDVMNRIRTSVSTIAICAAVALPLLAAEKLGAKIGLWETTTTMNVGGIAIPGLPPEALAAMPPAQRAQLEQMMKAVTAPRTTTAKSCITEKDLEDGAFRPQDSADMKCKFTTTSSTPKRQEATFQCTTTTGPADGRLVVDVVDADHIKGTMQMKSPQMSLDIKFESRWLGATCPAAGK